MIEEDGIAIPDEVLSVVIEPASREQALRSEQRVAVIIGTNVRRLPDRGTPSQPDLGPDGSQRPEKLGLRPNGPPPGSVGQLIGP